MIFLCFPERTAIWEAVAGSVQEQLLLRKVGRHPHPPCLLRGVGSLRGPGVWPPATLPILRKQETHPKSPHQWTNRARGRVVSPGVGGIVPQGWCQLLEGPPDTLRLLLP